MGVELIMCEDKMSQESSPSSSSCSFGGDEIMIRGRGEDKRGFENRTERVAMRRQKMCV